MAVYVGSPHGQGLEVSLGYFLLPLVMLLIGRYVYQERLTIIQKLAAFSAAVGVIHEIYQVGGISWATLLVALGFPPYFVLRKKLKTAHLGGLWFDILLTFPVALYIATGHGSVGALFTDFPKLYLLLPLLAVISAAAFMSYTVASKLLPLSLFGLLGYVEPVLMVAVALTLGERISDEQWLTYLPIWIAVALLALNGALYLKRARLPI